MLCAVGPQLVFDNQLSSIKNFPATAPSAKLDVHPITARYAQLTASLLLLNADYQVGRSRPSVSSSAADRCNAGMHAA